MRTIAILVIAGVIGLPAAALSQARGTTTTKPAGRAAATPPPPPAVPKIEPAMVSCPAKPLGTSPTTNRTYCDVQIGNDAAAGNIITLPPHVGPVTLMFDLHNRHTYSQDLVNAKKAYSRYTARIGVLSANNFLLARAVVDNEFRTEADLFDRVGGGSGPGGLKAVAPTGVEAITLVIPEEHDSVSILGERLSVVRAEDVDTFTAAGRPIALISNVRVEYVPLPPAKPATTAKPTTAKPATAKPATAKPTTAKPAK